MKTSENDRLSRTQRFFLAIADQRLDAAAVELTEEAVFHVPGTSMLAGTFRGRADITDRLFCRFFELTSGREALQWVDWMAGTNYVSVLVRAHMQAGLLSFEGNHLFLVAFDPSGLLGHISLFVEDEARLQRFLVSLQAKLGDPSVSPEG